MLPLKGWEMLLWNSPLKELLNSCPRNGEQIRKGGGKKEGYVKLGV